MRRALVVVFVVVAAVLLALWFALKPPSPLRAAADGDFAISNVTVINPTVDRTSDATISVSHGRIESVSTGPPPTGESVLEEFAGAFALPGLIDMHGHLPPKTALSLSGYMAFLYLMHGVTTIRDVGDGDGTSVPAARTGIEEGSFPGPRILSCGPFVAGSDALRWPNTRVVRTPADAEAVVAEIAADGNTCIKSYEDLDAPRIAALKSAVERHGMQLLGHVPMGVTYEEALLPDVQHFFGVPPPETLARDHVLDRTATWKAVDDARLDLIVDATIEHGIINTPTLVSSEQLLSFEDYEAAQKSRPAQLMPRLYPEVVWDPDGGMPFWRGIREFLPDIREANQKKRRLLKRLFDAGAPLQLGTDAQQPFVAPRWGLQREMELFVESGIPPEDVWAMATWKAGETLAEGLGRIQTGAPADFLLFGSDPTQSLDALDTLLAVVAQGKLYPREEIDKALEVYLRHFRGATVTAISLPVARMTLRRSVLRDY